jgi:hypothetical protein
MPRFDIYTVAATEGHARECRVPIIKRGEIEADSAWDALSRFDFDGREKPVADFAYVPFADYRDCAIGYEASDPSHPILWLAAHHIA